MARRKWTFIVLVCVYNLVSARPSQESFNSTLATNVSSEIPNRSLSDVPSSSSTKPPLLSSTTESSSSSRDVKTKLPMIGESIKMVTSQLLQNPSNSSDPDIVSDTRIPPKIKTQVAHKHKITTRQEIAEEKVENSHAGIAVPVTMEELESENKIIHTNNESSTSNEGISTWILLSNPTSKDNNTISSTEATKPEESTKKAKPSNKNKTKRPQQNNTKNVQNKRPIIGSTNKSDLIAGGSAINENVFNKIKDTVLSNVQKNKNASINRTTTTTTTTTTVSPTTVALLNKETTKPSTTLSVSKTVSKPLKKKNKNKLKISTTLAPTVSDSALLPMEPKVQEIELEISTPATTTKKPKRTSSKKKKKNKNKTKKTKPPAADNIASETKVANKTKSVKTKKPATKNPVAKNPITTQIYNYLSREVMPSVGVGIVGLAGLVGLAGYFLYPFSTPVRRTFEVDKKDNLYTHNAEEYASEGNGQAEEEMLGTVLAGMPAHSKNKFNPYSGQNNNNRYSPKKDKDQNIRYRQVANKYESPNYNTQYQQNYQQKTGLAHGAVYSEPVNYNTQYETRHAYTTENRYPYDAKNTFSYSAAVEPIYAAPQTGPSVVTSYDSDATNSVVYGVKPNIDTEFKPVYPFEGQVYSETTSQPAMTYPPTSMYLGSNNESDRSNEMKYEENSDSEEDNKFVVGNVPKEISDSVTPAIVPEHGPRNLVRRRRNVTSHKKRSIVGSIEDILKATKIGKHDGLSNEIDEALRQTVNLDDNNMDNEITNLNIKPTDLLMSDNLIKESVKTNLHPVYAISSDDVKGGESTSLNKDSIKDTLKEQVVESVSTLPIQSDVKTTTESNISNDLETTTKSFKVYEVFTTNGSNTGTTEETKEQQVETTTEDKKINTETTTDATTTTTLIPSTSPFSQTKGPTEPTFTSTQRPRPTFNPNTITYPPYNEEGSFFTFIKRLFEFKYRLGLSILQTTSDTLNRYLRNMESSTDKVAKASKF